MSSNRCAFAVAAMMLSTLSGCAGGTPAGGSGPALADLAYAQADFSGGTGSDFASSSPDMTVRDRSLVEARPYTLKVPASYNPQVPTPLLLSLHGFTSDEAEQIAFFHLDTLADQKGFILAAPNGTKNPLGQRFWNATDYCCDLFGSGVDDVAYLTAVLDDVQALYNVDPKRVYILGHSNGGFMAHRMACDRSSRIAAIVSYAGAQWNDPSKCNPTDKIAVLEVHGNADTTVFYNGGTRGNAIYPSAPTTVATWAAKNGCSPTRSSSGAAMDIINLPGAETEPTEHAGCATGGAAALWTMQAGGHTTPIVTGGEEHLWSFLDAHPKP
jgi:polyhydroxybutyrate depolymerase